MVDMKVLETSQLILTACYCPLDWRGLFYNQNCIWTQTYWMSVCVTEFIEIPMTLRKSSREQFHTSFLSKSGAVAIPNSITLLNILFCQVCPTSEFFFLLKHSQITHWRVQTISLQLETQYTVFMQTSWERLQGLRTLLWLPEIVNAFSIKILTESTALCILECVM